MTVDRGSSRTSASEQAWQQLARGYERSRFFVTAPDVLKRGKKLLVRDPVVLDLTVLTGIALGVVLVVMAFVHGLGSGWLELVFGILLIAAPLAFLRLRWMVIDPESGMVVFVEGRAAMLHKTRLPLNDVLVAQGVMSPNGDLVDPHLVWLRHARGGKPLMLGAAMENLPDFASQTVESLSEVMGSAMPPRLDELGFASAQAVEVAASARIVSVGGLLGMVMIPPVVLVIIALLFFALSLVGAGILMLGAGLVWPFVMLGTVVVAMKVDRCPNCGRMHRYRKKDRGNRISCRCRFAWLAGQGTNLRTG